MPSKLFLSQLMGAINQGNLESIKSLCAMFDYKGYKNLHNQTLVHVAASTEDVAFLQWLLNRVDPQINLVINSIDNFGFTPLDYAAKNNFQQHIRLLLCAGAKYDEALLAEHEMLEENNLMVGGDFLLTDREIWLKNILAAKKQLDSDMQNMQHHANGINYIKKKFLEKKFIAAWENFDHIRKISIQEVVANNRAEQYKSLPSSVAVLKKLFGKIEVASGRKDLDDETRNILNAALKDCELKIKSFVESEQSLAKQLEVGLERLFEKVKNMNFDFCTGTTTIIKNQNIMSRRVAQDKKFKIAEGLGSNKEHDAIDRWFIFGFLLPRGMSYPWEIFNDYDDSFNQTLVYRFDFNKLQPFIARGKLDFMIKGQDPELIQQQQVISAYQYGKVFYLQESLVNKSKKITVINDDGEKIETVLKEEDQFYKGVDVLSQVALDVVKMVKRIAESDLRSALDLLTPFSDAYIDEHDEKEIEKIQYERACELYCKADLREATFTNNLPFSEGENIFLRKIEARFLKREKNFSKMLLRQDFLGLKKALTDKSQRSEFIDQIRDSLQGLDVPVEFISLAKITYAPLFKEKDSFTTLPPLAHLLFFGNKNIVKLLLDFGANVNLQGSHDHNYSALMQNTYKYGLSALMVAAKKGFLDDVKFLLKRQANLHAIAYLDAHDEPKIVNALTLASRSGHWGIVECLINHGARLPNGEPYTASVLPVLREISELLWLIAESNVKACNIDYNPVAQKLFFYIKSDGDSRSENRVHSFQATIISYLLGLQNYQDKSPLEFKFIPAFMAIDFKKQQISTNLETKSHERSGLKSLNEVRDVFLARELSIFLACVHLEDCPDCFSKRQGVTSVKYLLKKPLVHDGFVECQFEDNAIKLKLNANFKRDKNWGKLFIKQLSAKLSIMESFIDAKLLDNCLEITIHQVIYSDLISKLKAARNNYQGLLVINKQGELALAERWDMYQNVIGYASFGGHNAYPYAPEIGVLDQLLEGGLLPRDEYKPILINQKKDERLYLAHYEQLTLTSEAKKYCDQYDKPFFAEVAEFRDQSEEFYSLSRLRHEKIRLRNLTTITDYLVFEQNRINELLIKNLGKNSARIYIPPYCPVYYDDYEDSDSNDGSFEGEKDSYRLLEEDTGILIFIGQEAKIKAIKFWLLSKFDKNSLIMQALPNGLAVTNCEPFVFFNLIQTASAADFNFTEEDLNEFQFMDTDESKEIRCYSEILEENKHLDLDCLHLLIAENHLFFWLKDLKMEEVFEAFASASIQEFKQLVEVLNEKYDTPIRYLDRMNVMRELLTALSGEQRKIFISAFRFDQDFRGLLQSFDAKDKEMLFKKLPLAVNPRQTMFFSKRKFDQVENLSGANNNNRNNANNSGNNDAYDQNKRKKP